MQLHQSQQLGKGCHLHEHEISWNDDVIRKKSPHRARTGMGLNLSSGSLQITQSSDSQQQ